MDWTTKVKDGGMLILTESCERLRGLGCKRNKSVYTFHYFFPVSVCRVINDP